MKPIDETVFQKKRKAEPMAFNPPPVPTQHQPPLDDEIIRSVARSPARSNVRPPVRSNERSHKTPRHTKSKTVVVSPSSLYVFDRPKVRRKIRQSFDIFQDQYEALKKLQIAEHEHSGAKTKKLGDIVQEALDKYIHDKAQVLSNTSLRKEGA